MGINSNEWQCLEDVRREREYKESERKWHDERRRKAAPEKLREEIGWDLLKHRNGLKKVLEWLALPNANASEVEVQTSRKLISDLESLIKSLSPELVEAEEESTDVGKTKTSSV